MLRVSRTMKLMPMMTKKTQTKLQENSGSNLQFREAVR
jgi:hypothetical protein